MFEFKVGKASDLICVKQRLKAVHINNAALHDLESKGVNTREHFPLIAEGRGLCLSIYTMKRNGNVITAGKSSESVAWIPSDMVQLKAISEIWFDAASIEVYHKYMIVNMQLEQAQSRAFWGMWQCSPIRKMSRSFCFLCLTYCHCGKAVCSTVAMVAMVAMKGRWMPQRQRVLQTEGQSRECYVVFT